MDELLDDIAALVFLLTPEKLQAVAKRIRMTDINKANSVLSDVVSTPTATGVINQLVEAWKDTNLSADELASMLLAAGHVLSKALNYQTIELVWTGPKTPFVPARQTEQVLLQVINEAEQTLIITSFVAYDVPSIVEALNKANDRGVVIAMLLEMSREHGGNISFDAIGKMRDAVPSAQLYSWMNKTDSFIGGSVHAKIIVADEKICFITSANLTGHAMEKNMEAGLLLNGGNIPYLLKQHFFALISTKVLQAI